LKIIRLKTAGNLQSKIFKGLIRRETFEERPVLAKYKEGDNKGLGSWFTVSGSWLKVKKPETTNQKPSL
jgi:hypothetical protein